MLQFIGSFSAFKINEKNIEYNNIFYIMKSYTTNKTDYILNFYSKDNYQIYWVV